MKNPLTLPGIEPATFRFVAQHLNHSAAAVDILSTDHIFCIRQILEKRGGGIYWGSTSAIYEGESKSKGNF